MNSQRQQSSAYLPTFIIGGTPSSERQRKYSSTPSPSPKNRSNEVISSDLYTKEQSHSNSISKANDENELPPVKSLYDIGRSPERGLFMKASPSKQKNAVNYSSNASAETSFAEDNSFVFDEMEIEQVSSVSHPSSLLQAQQASSYYRQQQQSLASSAVEDGDSILVFGFPPLQSSFVLNLFKEFGNVLHTTHKAGTNWMLIDFEYPKSSIPRALSKNASLIRGEFMIGVVPYSNSVNRLRKEQNFYDRFQMKKKEENSSIFASSSWDDFQNISDAKALTSSTDETLLNNPQSLSSLFHRIVEYILSW